MLKDASLLFLSLLSHIFITQKIIQKLRNAGERHQAKLSIKHYRLLRFYLNENKNKREKTPQMFLLLRYFYQNQAFIKVWQWLSVRSRHTHTNKHNHNPPWHLPVSDLSHPVARTVSVTMSCALWQFSPSGWSTGPYGAIQGHRAASDEKHQLNIKYWVHVSMSITTSLQNYWL